MPSRRMSLLLCATLVLFASLLAACGSPSTMKLAGNAMLPNFHDGQVVNVQTVSASDLRRFDVVIFKKEGITNMKRLIGMPGDTVTIQDGQVFINGAVLDEPYDVSGSTQAQGTSAYTLGTDEFFVLGDNREHSTDSRMFGPVLASEITKRAVP